MHDCILSSNSGFVKTFLISDVQPTENGRGSTPFSPSFHCFFWHCQRNVILRKQVELAFPFSFFVKVTKKMVGVARFELAAPCSQNRCANRTALYPDNCTSIILSSGIHSNHRFLQFLTKSF